MTVPELAVAAMGEQYPAEVEPFRWCSWWLLGHVLVALRLQPDGVLVDLGCGRGGVGSWPATATAVRLDGSGVAIAAARRGPGDSGSRVGRTSPSLPRPGCPTAVPPRS